MAKPITPLVRLQKALGSLVQTTEPECFAASFDNARLSFMPEAVVKPAVEADIATVLKLANTYKMPVTVRGAGTSTTGSASPVKGGWVIDLSGWNKVHIDAAAGVAYVQPGVTIASIQAEAEKEGWAYPPDPSSHKWATIGGAIACNAGGMRGAKYGVTRDYVLALEGFLATGEYVRWGADLRKFAAGFNLRDLWIGSEGMLGIITGAALKLLPKPAARRTLLAQFANEDKAITAVQRIFQARLVPSILEFLDRQSIECTVRLLKDKGEGTVAKDGTLRLSKRLSLPAKPVAVLLIEVDGHPAQVKDDYALLQETLKPLTLAVSEATTPEEAELLWSIRRRCSKAMFQMGDSKLNEDVVVPLRSQKELLKYTLQLKRETGLATPTFGHAADGNFHVHLMFQRSDPGQCAAAERGVQALMEKVVALGGAITGEHGIGLAKSVFLHLQHGPAEIAAMQAVKKALDPNGILNPGKLFEPFRVWEHTPVKVHLPWDH
ncbi:MAG: FAD-linked oxidase C-terminal domain-containing protein [Verrucomicrobiota bacterium]|nr:FAD-linked oxidase C-terminal domain-containing protein [Verrucomicrobiota bacterium]